MRYDRTTEYVLRGSMVVLISKEVVLPKGSPAGEMHRRLTDLWEHAGTMGAYASTDNDYRPSVSLR